MHEVRVWASVQVKRDRGTEGQWEVGGSEFLHGVQVDSNIQLSKGV